MKIIEYRMYCETEAAYVTVLKKETDSVPTVCPNNAGHTITAGSVIILKIYDDAVTTDEEGSLKTTQAPMLGAEQYYYTPNMSDKCAWYEGSTQVTEKALTDSGDLTTWNSGDTYWIDLQHHRVFDDWRLTAATPAYIPKVEVLPDGESVWVEKTESIPGVSGDYQINYATGQVVFGSALGSGDQVRASYFKAGSYKYTIQPPAGKKLKITHIEIHGTNDINVKSAIQYTIYGYGALIGSVKDKDLTAPPGSPTPLDAYIVATPATGDWAGHENDMATWSGTAWVFYTPEAGVAVTVDDESDAIYTFNGYFWQAGKLEVDKAVYGTIIDFIAESVGSYPVVPAFGGNTAIGLGGRVRGMPQDLVSLPFNYLTTRVMKASQGAELIVTLTEGGEAWGGTFSGATFYAIVEDE